MFPAPLPSASRQHHHRRAASIALVCAALFPASRQLGCALARKLRRGDEASPGDAVEVVAAPPVAVEVLDADGDVSAPLAECVMLEYIFSDEQSEERLAAGATWAECEVLEELSSDEQSEEGLAAGAKWAECVVLEDISSDEQSEEGPAAGRDEVAQRDGARGGGPAGAAGAGAGARGAGTPSARKQQTAAGQRAAAAKKPLLAPTADVQSVLNERRMCDTNGLCVYKQNGVRLTTESFLSMALFEHREGAPALWPAPLIGPGLAPELAFWPRAAFAAGGGFFRGGGACGGGARAGAKKGKTQQTPKLRLLPPAMAGAIQVRRAHREVASGAGGGREATDSATASASATASSPPTRVCIGYGVFATDFIPKGTVVLREILPQVAYDHKQQAHFWLVDEKAIRRQRQADYRQSPKAGGDRSASSGGESGDESLEGSGRDGSAAARSTGTAASSAAGGGGGGDEEVLRGRAIYGSDWSSTVYLLNSSRVPRAEREQREAEIRAGRKRDLRNLQLDNYREALPRPNVLPLTPDATTGAVEVVTLEDITQGSELLFDYDWDFYADGSDEFLHGKNAALPMRDLVARLAATAEAVARDDERGSGRAAPERRSGGGAGAARGAAGAAFAHDNDAEGGDWLSDGELGGVFSSTSSPLSRAGRAEGRGGRRDGAAAASGGAAAGAAQSSSGRGPFSRQPARRARGAVGSNCEGAAGGEWEDASALLEGALPAQTRKRGRPKTEKGAAAAASPKRGRKSGKQVRSERMKAANGMCEDRALAKALQESRRLAERGE